MTKRIFLLSGLAILAVVCNHATSWGLTAMFWWTDHYRPVSAPNFDQIGTLPYYLLLVVRKLTVFCVPAFLFVSGFFAVYASGGSQPTSRWRVVRTRIWNLLVPYLIWSGVILIGDALQGKIYSPPEYAARLVTGEVAGGYYFVPLLCQFYLLSPFLIPLVRAQPRRMLLGSAILQLAAMLPSYLSLLWQSETPALRVATLLSQDWLVFTWAFFFTLGLASGCHLPALKQHLARWKRWLPLAVVVLGTVATVESEAVFRLTKRDWPSSPLTIWSSLYAVAFVLCFLSLGDLPAAVTKPLQYLSGRTYGLYLIHNQAMELVARVIRQIAPGILVQQITLFQPLIFSVGLGVPLALMVLVTRSRMRKGYRYLFG